MDSLHHHHSLFFPIVDQNLDDWLNEAGTKKEQQSSSQPTLAQASGPGHLLVSSNAHAHHDSITSHLTSLLLLYLYPSFRPLFGPHVDRGENEGKLGKTRGGTWALFLRIYHPFAPNVI